MNMVTQSAIAVTLFLGGPSGLFDVPGLPAPVEGIGWFLLKISFFLFGYIWLRAALPRLRYDQLMDVGWKILIPVGLLWLAVSATFRVARDQGWPIWVYFGAVAGAAAVGGLLYVSMPRRQGIRGALEEPAPQDEVVR
jgi:NADH-quinone oxidoreductase subunit H